MSEEVKDALEQAIMACVEDNTFSAKALDNISALRTEAASLAEKLKNREETITELRADLRETTRLKDHAEDRLTKTDEKLKEAQKLHAEATEMMAKASTAIAVADAYKDCLHTVFKPATVRRTVHGNVPVAVPTTDNGMTGHVQSQYFDKTTEESDE